MTFLMTGPALTVVSVKLNSPWSSVRQSAAQDESIERPVHEDPIVVIGTGLAGYTWLKEFRQRHDKQGVIMITQDDGAFYSKPSLSTGLAQGKSADALIRKTAEEMSQEFDVQIMTECTVENINATEKVIRTDRGPIRYSSVIIAQGADPIRLPLQGDGADDVLHVNNLNDYRRFREQLDGAKRVALLVPD